MINATLWTLPCLTNHILAITKTSNTVELLSLRIIWQLAILRFMSCDLTQIKILGEAKFIHRKQQILLHINIMYKVFYDFDHCIYSLTFIWKNSSCKCWQIHTEKYVLGDCFWSLSVIFFVVAYYNKDKIVVQIAAWFTDLPMLSCRYVLRTANWFLLYCL